MQVKDIFAGNDDSEGKANKLVEYLDTWYMNQETAQ